MSADQPSSIQCDSKLKVKDVCRQFQLKSDELLASKLQDQEWFERYQGNRRFAQHKQENIAASRPVAQMCQSAEYEQLKERHRLLEQIEQTDALIALQIQNDMLEEEERERRAQQLRDQELAKAMQLSQQQQQQARESTNVNQEEIKATNEAESRVMDKIESTREKASDSTKIHKLAQILQAHEKRQESSSNTSAAQSAKRSPPVPAERRHGTASAVSKRESST